MTYLLDTNIVSYFLKGASPALTERILNSDPEELAISVVSAGELRYGIRKLRASRRSALLTRQLDDLLNVIAPKPVPMEAANHYGAIRAHLDAAGTPVGGNDLWIAAHALAHNMTLVTHNVREFRRIPGLSVENWFEKS